MDFAAELSRLNLDPTLVAGMMARLQQADHDAAQLAQQHAEIQKQRIEIQHRELELRNKDLKIQALTLELAHHKRIRFGHKNEAFNPEQRELFQETWNTDLEAIGAEIEQLQTRPRREYTPTGRTHFPAELPRIEHRHEPASCQCGQCGQALVKIREDISEQLDVEPARFFVHRHIRPQYACRACETITAEPAPPALIDGGLAAPGLHAWVLIQKYLDHLPLYRIEQICTRQGVPIARTTLARWVGVLGVRLQPLVDRLTEVLKQQTVLHADETPVQQLDPGAGKTRRAYLWAYRSGIHASGPPIVVFDYQTSRSGSHARAFLASWRGALMVDDYVGYKGLFGEQVIELACLAHIRRKFFELSATQPHAGADEALGRIAELYAIEAEGKALAPDARHALRQSMALPRAQALQSWLQDHSERAAPGSGWRKALSHALKRWPAVLRYLEDGEYPIDNNPAENAIRPIALGRKNWLFTGSERAGQRAAAIQTLLATARLNGLDPQAWLKDTLEKLPVWPNSRIDELLPLRALPK